jgi:EAL domain-containing protein (putative c-di-GMP-specific phosphodiesterase class I)
MEDSGLSVWRLLNNAASDDESVELDRLCRMLHVLNFFRQADSFDGSLLIGVHERLLAAVSSNHGAVFRHILDVLDIPDDRILLQLPQARPDHQWAIGFVVANYRRNGFRVATRAANVDEAVQHLEQLRPDLIRIDSHASGNDERLADVIEYADALGTTLLFSRVDSQSDLHRVSNALALSGTISTDQLWNTGALSGQPRASFVDSEVLSARAHEESRRKTSPAVLQV